MKELDYPFDANYIIEHKKRLRKQLLQEGSQRTLVKIAVLGGSTTKDIVDILELFLLNYGIETKFYESEYGQYYQDAILPNPALEKFRPDIIYICTSNHNISRYPGISDSPDLVNKLIMTTLNKFEGMWESLSKQYNCPIIQNNFELPYYRLMGNRESYDIHGSVHFVTRLNMEFYQYAQKCEWLYICDLNYISSDYGLRKWSDPWYWYMYKYSMALTAIPYLSFNVANIVKSLMGRNKKGFVLDLDNTLWGGIIGEDGVDNIQLGQEDPQGQAYLEFQRYIKTYQQLGVILNINSKNDYDNAMAGIKHPDSLLSEDDFISIKANWNSKDENFRHIAEELSLLPESLVVLDDNPAERHLIREQFPSVQIPELSEAAYYIGEIDRAGYFEVTTLSDDDLKRNEMYQTKQLQLEEQKAFASYGDYLKSLDMKAYIRPFEAVYMARIAQLTNKSNQFNLTTRRYMQREIEEIADSDEYITLYGKLMDRFGDNGVVSVIIGHIEEDICHIELWIMSCRVLKRDMEYAMMDMLVKRCLDSGIKIIKGYYYPTVKNNMVKNFYELMGFKKILENENGNTEWSLDITQKYITRNYYIEQVEEIE